MKTTRQFSAVSCEIVFVTRHGDRIGADMTRDCVESLLTEKLLCMALRLPLLDERRGGEARL